ncbi:MAG: acyl-CoA reductase, partial [Bacteroidia bacterium]|nr:acyl-CoA reductase [Bacteroidia bacterium]
MNLQQRIYLLSRLGQYILSHDADWQSAKERAGWQNGWFIPQFVDLAAENIATQFFTKKKKLEKWAGCYRLPTITDQPK